MKPAPVSFATNHNNFDLVRLIAALQVVVIHVIHEMPGLQNDFLVKALSLFPGVPIFFFISGYLIGGSWQRNPHLASYISNRALRIFPALWVAVFFSLVMLIVFYATPMRENIGTSLMWLVMQVTFLQSWNPPFLRGYGTGLVNPALWTIPVELSFYVVLPLLYMLGERLRRLRLVLWGAATLSFVIFYFVINQLDPANPSQTLARKVLTVSPASFVTWLWMFLIGVLAQAEGERLRSLVRGRFPLFAVIAVAVGSLSLWVDIPPFLHLPGNEIGLLNALTLSAACLSFAYSYSGLAQRWLRGFDLSYGIYLFHMPIVNALIMANVVGWWGGVSVMVGTLTCAFLSWTFVERVALRHKSRVQEVLTNRFRLPAKVVL
jgi:peptidoglycan/LPS O-acetylase OafA/YrhL